VLVRLLLVRLLVVEIVLVQLVVVRLVVMQMVVVQLVCGRVVGAGAVGDRAVGDPVVGGRAVVVHRAVSTRVVAGRAVGARAVGDRVDGGRAVGDPAVGRRAVGAREVGRRAVGSLLVRLLVVAMVVVQLEVAAMVLMWLVVGDLLWAVVWIVAACAELVWLDVPVPPSDTQRVGEVADNMMGSEVVRCALVCGVEFVCRAGVDSGPKVVSGIVVGIGGFVRCVEVVCGAACAELLWLDMLVSPSGTQLSTRTTGVMVAVVAHGGEDGVLNPLNRVPCRCRLCRCCDCRSLP